MYRKAKAKTILTVAAKITPYFPCVCTTGRCEMHWICPTTEDKSTCQTCWIDLETTKRKLDDCNGSPDLFITDNATLRGEKVCSCVSVRLMQRERGTCRQRVRERERSITGFALSAQCSVTGARLVQRALWRYITRSFSVSKFVSAFCVWLYEIVLDIWRKGGKDSLEQLTYQWIKHLKAISLRTFIQNTKQSVQRVL